MEKNYGLLLLHREITEKNWIAKIQQKEHLKSGNGRSGPNGMTTRWLNGEEMWLAVVLPRSPMAIGERKEEGVAGERKEIGCIIYD